MVAGPSTTGTDDFIGIIVDMRSKNPGLSFSAAGKVGSASLVKLSSLVGRDKVGLAFCNWPSIFL